MIFWCLYLWIDAVGWVTPMCKNLPQKSSRFTISRSDLIWSNCIKLGKVIESKVVVPFVCVRDGRLLSISLGHDWISRVSCHSDWLSQQFDECSFVTLVVMNWTYNTTFSYTGYNLLGRATSNCYGRASFIVSWLWHFSSHQAWKPSLLH